MYGINSINIVFIITIIIIVIVIMTLHYYYYVLTRLYSTRWSTLQKHIVD